MIAQPQILLQISNASGDKAGKLMPEVREEVATIVVVGKLNPAIFHPEWLRSKGFIGEAEADSAVRDGGLKFVHPELARVDLSWMRLQVDTDRFVLAGLEDPFVRVRDFAISCFGVLAETPVRAVGLNRTSIFRAASDSEWNRLGDMLAPKAPWAELLGEQPEGGERTGGLRTMTMERSRRPDGKPGYIRVSVEALETGHSDTKIDVNDHFQLASGDRHATGADAARLIAEQWEQSFARAKGLSESVMRAADGR